MRQDPVKIVATQGSMPLAKDVADILTKRLPSIMVPHNGLLCVPKVDEFHNENQEVQLIESVNGHTVVVVHTMTPPFHREQDELYTLLDAVDNAGPEETIVVFAYMPHSRSDKKDKPHISVMGRRFAKIINKAFGIRRVLLLDPHSEYLKGYFDPMAKEITAAYLIIDYLLRCVFPNFQENELMFVHPDAGAVNRERDIARTLNLPISIILKAHFDNSGNIDIKKLVGRPKNKNCVVFDDEVLSFGTADKNTDRLLDAGAKSVTFAATSAILREKGTKDADLIRRLLKSKIRQFIFTDSIPIKHKIPVGTGKRVVVLPSAGLIAEAVLRMLTNGSTTELYSLDAVPSYRLEPWMA